jgi:hypothetical protein
MAVGLVSQRSTVAGLALGYALLATAACGRPANLDLSLSRPTDSQLFRVSVDSQTHPVPMSEIHQWALHVADAGGRPVVGAAISVDGGMPEHGHGLPTAPLVEATGSPGDYVIRGMKFSITGWWELKLNLRAPDGRADKITFNIVL